MTDSDPLDPLRSLPEWIFFMTKLGDEFDVHVRAYSRVATVIVELTNADDLKSLQSKLWRLRKLAKVAELEAERERLWDKNERLRGVQPDAQRSLRESILFATELGNEFDVRVCVHWRTATTVVDILNRDDLKSLKAKLWRARKSAIKFMAELEEQERRDAVLDQIAEEAE
jgi:hypothetical protein